MKLVDLEPWILVSSTGKDQRVRGVEGPWARKWVIAAYGSWRDSEAREDFLGPEWMVEAGARAEMRQVRILPHFPYE